MSTWFEIRNKPEKGEVIAIWHCEDDDYRLAFGAQDVKYPPEMEDDKRTYGREEAIGILDSIVNEVSEAEFSVLSEIADIPQIISNGFLHHLGVLEWEHKRDPEGFRKFGSFCIPCTGTVYAKVYTVKPPEKKSDEELVKATVVDTIEESPTRNMSADPYND